ncbi:MAG: M48 family metallopeptidase [Candidatus Kryptoniota bacterium]
MKKVLVQFAVLAASFFCIWFLLSRVDFVRHFHVEQITKDNEKKLGELVLDDVRRENRELESDSVQSFVNIVKKRLCDANGIADSSITLHIMIKDDVNAFALPDGHIVVYTGLIDYCKSPEELSGVMAHEIGHIEHGDVMKKLVRDVGLSMLTTIAGGNADQEIGQDMVRLLSSSAFDREQESEADTTAVHMMAKANIDPQYLANLLFRLSQEKDNIPKHFEWLSTHPNSQYRAAEILKLRKLVTFQPKQIADSTYWDAIKKIVDDSKRD